MMSFESYEQLAEFCRRFVKQNMASEVYVANDLLPEVIFQIVGKEFAEALAKRAEWHDTEAEWWEKRIKDAGDKGQVADLHISGDPLHADRDRAKDHRDSASKFRFMSAHVLPEKMYALTYSDVARYELDKRG